MKKITLAVLAAVACFLVNAETVKVGFAVKDISPEAEALQKGIRVSGWSASKPTKKLHDKLFIRTVAMRDKNNTLLVILTADTLKFHAADAHIIHEWFEQKFKVNRWHLIMNASHTHQAPNWYFRNKSAHPKVYRKRFLDAVKAGISLAVKNATRPMVVKFAALKIRKDMIFNKVYSGYSYQAKRKKMIREGKSEQYKILADKFNFVDTDFPVFAFFDAATKKMAGILWSVAAHPTYKIGPGTPVSANAPGAVARALHRVYGNDVVTMFAQGAAGDLKMKFPAVSDKIRYKYFSKTKTRGFIWLEGKDKGKMVTEEQYLKALDAYGMLFADIIKQGFKDNKFKEIKNIDFKIAGKAAKIPLALKRPPKRSKIGQVNRCFWKRPKGSVQSHRKIINDPESTEMAKYCATEAVQKIYDDKHAAYLIWFAKIEFNKHFQILAMSNEVCCEIGINAKKYYRQKGIETVFFGYSPFGSPYYPSNLHKAEETYQGCFMHPEAGFDFDKFALDNIKSLKAR